MSQTDSHKWDRIYRTGDHGRQQAAEVLCRNQHLLPASGKALDLACGLGTNALLLASLGLQTSAWDISGTAIERLQETAAAQGLELNLERRDIVSQPPGPDSFDIIVVCRFLDRMIIPNLIDALHQDGLIFYQTFINEKTDDTGPDNPAYRLDANELLALFNGLHIVMYSEEGTIGNVKQGLRNEAMLIAQRR